MLRAYIWHCGDDQQHKETAEVQEDEHDRVGRQRRSTKLSSPWVSSADRLHTTKTAAFAATPRTNDPHSYSSCWMECQEPVPLYCYRESPYRAAMMIMIYEAACLREGRSESSSSSPSSWRVSYPTAVRARTGTDSTAFVDRTEIQ